MEKFSVEQVLKISGWGVKFKNFWVGGGFIGISILVVVPIKKTRKSALRGTYTPGW